jgi:hypothetical protein
MLTLVLVRGMALIMVPAVRAFFPTLPTLVLRCTAAVIDLLAAR